MASDPRKQQKRKERRNKRAKEKRKEGARAYSLSHSPTALMSSNDDAPFVACVIHQHAFTQGMGSLTVCRDFGKGKLVAVVFLVDLYCLGIKNVIIQLTNPGEVKKNVARMYADEPPEQLTPAEAKKLVIGAAAYANRYGFFAHEDYERGLAIFRGVDASAATREFVFGQKGKPYYFAGPYDTPAFQHRVKETLERTAGPGGYEFTMILGRSPMDDRNAVWADDEEDEDSEGDEDGEEDEKPHVLQ